jgi:flagellar hook-basal body complex protein FliE
MMQSAIEAVGALAAVQAGMPTMAGAVLIDASTGARTLEGFAGVMQRELSHMNASVSTAESAMRDLAAGKPVELHDVMISLERARISVQTFVQVRNKLVESYQDLMRMQL